MIRRLESALSLVERVVTSIAVACLFAILAGRGFSTLWRGVWDHEHRAVLPTHERQRLSAAAESLQAGQSTPLFASPASTNPHGPPLRRGFTPGRAVSTRGTATRQPA